MACLVRVVLTVMLALLFTAAHALESTAYTTSRDSVSLVSQSDDMAAGKPVRLGLRMVLAPGWHTYWSNPGDAGAPPTIEITGATAGPIDFPSPERLPEGPFTSYAYTGHVLLPFSVTAPGKTLAVEAHATWLVCATVCVPEEARFTLALPAGGGAPGAQAALFTAADARIPRPSPFPAHVTADGTLWLTAHSLSLRSAEFFPAAAGIIDQGAPQTLHVGADLVAIALKPLKGRIGTLTGVLRLTDRSGAIENLSIAATEAALPAPVSPVPGILAILVLAFAGGLVLNLMPCVLPVLAIKALGLARLSGADRTHVRWEAAAYTLGVVVAFCAIGGLTLAARSLGGAAGWGMQFQSPAFTTGMGLLLFAIGLNFSGVFTIGATLAGAGQGLASRGAFFTGLLAVLVATPCTAPFMGTALAAALAMPPAAGMLVFVALGLGLAFPYAALALTPRVAALLPRPGAWMDVFKHLLAFPMYGAALWMIWVAGQQTDAAGQAAVFAGALLTGFAAWAYGYGQSRERPIVLNGSAIVAMLCVSALLVGLGRAVSANPAASGASADGSQPYSAQRLSALLAAHRPVFVDMSAAWCVTCLVNERLAIEPQAVREAFARHDVTYLKGDWTRQDAGISRFLQAHDRSGVPLYVYYSAQGASEVLPQILTPALVLNVVGQKAVPF